MRLKDATFRFKEKFKIVGGQHFYGQILDLPDTSRVSNFLSARRFLRTTTKTPVSPADVIQAGDFQFIVAQHGEGHYKGPLYTHFKLFQVDLVVDVVRNTKHRDPVTGVEKNWASNSVGDAYVSLQPNRELNDSDIKIQQPSYELISNIELKPDDIVNNGKWIVTKVDSMLGIYVVEVKAK